MSRGASRSYAPLAFVWAVALVIAVGSRVPSTHTDVPVVAALLLASYPLIDVVASAGWVSAGASERVQRVNTAVSALAVAAVAIAAFGSDAGATLIAFGAWAAVSGAIQFGVALHRRAGSGQLPMLVSGEISTLAGISFMAMSGMHKAHLADLGGYMALGAVLFLVWAVRNRAGRNAR